jgi:hypothetical protein
LAPSATRTDGAISESVLSDIKERQRRVSKDAPLRAERALCSGAFFEAIDRARYTASPLLSSGQIGATLELRPLFENSLTEVSADQ